MSLDPAAHRRAKSAFMVARTLPPAAREGWLEAEVADEAIRAEVRSLLAFDADEPILAQREAPAQVGDRLGLIGEVLDTRYRVDAFVAEGGFGAVYKAWHLRWDRPVAVKVFKPLPDEASHAEMQDAFVKEGALLAELSRRTPHIVQSFDVGTWHDAQGTPLLFTVLEWLEGQSLGDAFEASGRAPWSLARALEMLAPVAEALEIAHATGIAHRDVKPNNIFLVEEDGAPAVKLLDFGVAKVAAERARGFQSTAGKITAFTVDYGAPEQITREHGPTGPWTDVYGLALLMVELLSGQRPYGESSNPLMAMLRARDEAHRPTPRTLEVAVSDAVEAVFERALAVDPSARYVEAGAFWDALGVAHLAPPKRSLLGRLFGRS